jgi:RNA recognition motif-containing protein
MQLHISNLSLNIIETDLYKMFSRFGEVDNVKIVRDKLNNRSRGRAFVEMPVAKDAQMALLQLHHSESKGKRISVAEVGYQPAPDAWTFTAFSNFGQSE